MFVGYWLLAVSCWLLAVGFGACTGEERMPCYDLDLDIELRLMTYDV